jgi:hypothetical protein
MRTDTPNAMVPQRPSPAIPMSILLASGGLCAQQVPAPGPSNTFVIAPSTDPPTPEEANVKFVCPMDPDVRSKELGFSPRCGMRLVAGFLYFAGMTINPRAVKAGGRVAGGSL